MKRTTGLLAAALMCTSIVAVIAGVPGTQPKDTPSTSSADTPATVPSGPTTASTTRSSATTRIYTPAPIDPK